MFRRLFLTAALLVLAGCVSSAHVQAQRDSFRQTIPTCSGAEECRAKWEAAQLWVIRHAHYKIQTVTDVLIQTYNPEPNGTGLAARVTKEPLGGGRYQLVVYVWCNNPFGCRSNGWDEALAFNREVEAARP